MTDLPATLLVIGHAASGKSAWAEGAVLRATYGSGGQAVYVATAQAWDAEMQLKIAAHAARRGPDWSLIETPPDLAATCSERTAKEVVLIDCATMWLTRHVMEALDWEAAADAWIAAMRGSPARFVIVTNDVGGGVVPDNEMARAFQRSQGRLNQRLAAAADAVASVTAGLPHWLKGGPGA